MSSIHLRSTIVRRDRVVANDLNDSETVMLDVDQGLYFGVSNVGKFIWEHLEQPQSISQLVADLMAEYDVEESKCQQEVTAFIDELVAQGLVDVDDSPTAP